MKRFVIHLTDEQYDLFRAVELGPRPPAHIGTANAMRMERAAFETFDAVLTLLLNESKWRDIEPPTALDRETGKLDFWREATGLEDTE